MTPAPRLPRAPQPPAVRRLLWWMALPLAVAVGGAILFQIPAVQSAVFKPSVWLGPGIAVVNVAPAFVAFLFIWHGQRRIKRAVAVASGRACVNCVHDLNGLGETGACPECGRPFDIAADQHAWARVNMHK